MTPLFEEIVWGLQQRVQSFEIISEAHLDAGAGTAGESAGEHPEGELQVFSKSISASGLPNQLATAQIEVVRHCTKQFGTKSKTWRKVTYQ